jgi:predicted GH43/DUF377 family glycosyl hydrolase
MRCTLVLLLLTHIFSPWLYAQIHWSANRTEPVIGMDPDVRWEAIGQPTSILVNDTFKMWFADVYQNTSDPHLRSRIHYAWSTNGTTWQVDITPALEVGAAGEWDDEWLDTPEILKDISGYKLFYYGDSTFMQGQNHTHIGMASSADGFHWTKQGIVLSHGKTTDWDGHWVESPAAYFDTGSQEYYLWYTGIDNTGFAQIGLAVSDDAINWTKIPSNPLLTVEPNPSWCDFIAGVPSVIKTGDVFEMWYSGVNYDDQDSVSVGYAVSIDGIRWIKYPGNPVLGRVNSEDTTKFWAVDVVWNPGIEEYTMFYEMKYISDAEAIFRATAPRDILFSDNCNTTVTPEVFLQTGETVQLEAAGGKNYKWYPDTFLNNPDIANPTATPNTSILYKVLIAGDNCITVDSVMITVEPLSTDNCSTEREFTVFPNPADSYFTIKSNNLNLYHALLTLFNVSGEPIRKYSLTGNSIQINSNTLPLGLIFYSLTDDTGHTYNGKFIHGTRTN